MNYYQIRYLLHYCANMYGTSFLNIAYLAICNSTNMTNFQKPNNRSSIVFPGSITRWNPIANVVEYCCRVEYKPGFHLPSPGADRVLTIEFNAAAIALGIPERFLVYFAQYPFDNNHITIVARPI